MYLKSFSVFTARSLTRMYIETLVSTTRIQNISPWRYLRSFVITVFLFLSVFTEDAKERLSAFHYANKKI